MRLLLTLFFCWLITACGTLHIEEKSFIQPDSLTGDVPKTRLTQAALQAALPDARLSEQTVASASGSTLQGVLIRRPGAVATVLYFGGNAFHLDDSALELATRLVSCPVNLLVFDYRGYGRSSGAPTVANMQQDALSLFDHAQAQFADQVFVHGHSLGGFVAAYVAQQRPVRGVILEATANHPLDWAQANVPWYVKPFVDIAVSPTLQDVDNTRALAQFQQPSLVLAGGLDRVTPPALGRLVYDAIPVSTKRFVLVPAAHHNDILTHAEAVSAVCGLVQPGARPL